MRWINTVLLVFVTSCQPYIMSDHYLTLARTKCGNDLVTGKYKNRIEMLRYCYHPRETEILSGDIFHQHISRDLLEAKQAKEIELETLVEHNKLSRVAAQSVMTDYIIQINNMNRQRNFQNVSMLNMVSTSIQLQQLNNSVTRLQQK